MKELTIKEKAKAYDKALEKAKIWQEHLYDVNDKDYADELNYIFPELSESEDEKIRKDILCYFEHYAHDIKGADLQKWIAWLEKQGNKDSQVKIPTFTFDDILALQCCMETAKKVQNDKDLYEKLNNLHGRIYDAYYLEKQGEQNPYSGVSFKYNSHTWGMCARDDGVEILMDSELKAFISLDKSFIYPISSQSALEAVKEEKVDNQNCVKSIYDVKPKFKEGDWISNDMCDVHIASIEDGMYYFDEGDGLSIVFVDEHYHLWTIEDAMDGDVLFHSDSASNGIFIFKEIIDKGFAKEVICYCDYDSEDHFCLGEDHTCCWSDAKILYPATKEQRDLLFQKIKEAGYEWDSKKKELKIIDWSKHIKYEPNNPSIIEENTTWSDEDERNMQNIDAVLSYDRKLPEDTCVKLRNFLKTLKERIGWKPSEEQISSLRDVIYSLPHQPVLFTLYNDLKKLKGE